MLHLPQDHGIIPHPEQKTREKTRRGKNPEESPEKHPPDTSAYLLHTSLLGGIYTICSTCTILHAPHRDMLAGFDLCDLLLNDLQQHAFDR